MGKLASDQGPQTTLSVRLLVCSSQHAQLEEQICEQSPAGLTLKWSDICNHYHQDYARCATTTQWAGIWREKVQRKSWERSTVVHSAVSLLRHRSFPTRRHLTGPYEFVYTKLHITTTSRVS
jgi:hypothetical protein